MMFGPVDRSVMTTYLSSFCSDYRLSDASCVNGHGTLVDHCDAVQVDFASRECQNAFLEGLEKSGQLRSADRDRYAAFTDYSSRHR